VRGLFADDAFVALYVCGTLHFDGALGTVQVYANIPLPLASALDLEAGETVTWKVVDRTHLLLVRLPERKQLQGVARPSGQKKTRRSRESRS
jgi:hypothetical protein